MFTLKVFGQVVAFSMLVSFMFTTFLFREIRPDTSSYSWNLRLLDCNNLEYLKGCRHEIGHKMDDDMGDPSQSKEFGQAVQMYILFESTKEKMDDLVWVLVLHPGVFIFDESHQAPPQRELYATIYAWYNGDVSKIPETLRIFYSDDPYYQELYSCLSKRNQFNICDGRNFSFLEGDEMNSWISLGKTALSTVTSIGVGNIISNIVKSTTPSNLNTFNKICIGVGAFVLSGMIIDQATQYVNKEVDAIIQMVSSENDKVVISRVPEDNHKA